MTGNIVRTFDDVKARIDAGDLGGAQAAVSTVDGVGAYIKVDAEFVIITSTDAAHWAYLPAAVPGKVLMLFVPAVGCELRSAVAADDLNDVLVGATNQAALVADTLYTLRYTPGNWVMTGLDDNGVVVAPVVPDSI